MIDYFQTMLEGNQVFAGLVGASAIGSLMWVSRSIPKIIWKMLVSQFSVSLLVKETDDAFQFIEEWMSKLPSASRSRKLKVSTHYTGGDSPDWNLSVGFGTFLHWHGTRPILITRDLSEAKDSGSSSGPKELIKIQALGRSQESLRNIVREAQSIRRKGNVLRMFLWDGWWTNISPARIRDRDTLFFNEGFLEDIEADMDRFLSSEDMYHRRGRPYRRNYLFHGLGGTGKSSLAKYMATYMGRDLRTLSLNQVSDDAEMIRLLARSNPSQSVILIEDVDTFPVTASRDIQPSGNETEVSNESTELKAKAKGLSLSGLLNALDGVVVPEGLVIIMTTNHVEKLDEFLIRDGRVDVSREVGKANPETLKRMAKAFFPGNDTTIDACNTLQPMIAAKAGEILSKNSLDEALTLMSDKQMIDSKAA